MQVKCAIKKVICTVGTRNEILPLNKLLFTKIKRRKSSKDIADTTHVLSIWWSLKSFNDVLSSSLPLQGLLLTILLSWQKSTILPLIRLGRSRLLLYHCGAKSLGSENHEGWELTHAITELRTKFTAFLRITLTLLLAGLLFSVLQVTDLLGTLVHWIF